MFLDTQWVMSDPIISYNKNMCIAKISPTTMHWWYLCNFVVKYHTTKIIVTSVISHFDIV